MMFWYGNGMSGWGWGLMTFGSVVFWALVVFAVVFLVRYLSHGGQRPPAGPRSYGPPAGPAPTPEQLLAERYARGEIDDEEYRRRLAVLRGESPQARSGQASGVADE
jgi:putative membrane protein